MKIKLQGKKELEVDKKLGKIIAKQVQKVTFRQCKLWEKELTLRIKPKPKWLPGYVWEYLIRLILVQTEEML